MGHDFDTIVVGAGLSGLLAAVALGGAEPGAGRRVALVDAGEIERAGDNRATALAPSTLRLLHRLGVRPEPIQPMLGMRVGEGDADTPWQFELPVREAEPLAMTCANADLRRALLAALPDSVARFENARVESMDTRGRVSLQLDGGTSLTAALVVACDGHDSAVRRMAGLRVSRTDFGQRALVATVHHREPHEGIALQRFGAVGAVASLPLPDAGGAHRSQIVWSDRSRAVAAARALSGPALAALIDERLWGYLDIHAVEPGMSDYPLVGRRASALASERVALVGDAARTIHPLAGQGWNLAARDVAALCEGVTAAVETGQDIGTAGLLGYQRWRRADETLLGALTAALSSTRVPVVGRLLGHARRAAFAVTDELPLLHPFIRREAAGESGTLPALLS